MAGSTGSVWGLEKIDGKIYVLHDQGLYRLTDEGRLRPVATGCGVYSLHRCRDDGRYWVMGTYAGLGLVRQTGEGLEFVSRIADYNGFTRDFRIDDRGRVWVTVSGVGFVRLTLSDDRCRVTEVRNYDLAGDGGGSVLSTRIDQELVFCCEGRAWRIDYAADELVEAPGAEAVLRMCGQTPQSIVQQDNRFWYVGPDDAGYVERTGTSLVRRAGLLPHATRARISTDVRMIDGCAVVGYRNGVGFCGGEGTAQQQIEIGMAMAQGVNGVCRYRLGDPVFELPASMNTLRIRLLHLGAGRQLEYRIATLDPAWKRVRIEDCLQVPALPHGRHVVEMRTPGTTDPGAVRRLEVRVRPPWYISRAMMMLYALIFTAAMAGVRSYYLHKSRLAQKEQQRRAQELRAKELERLEKENLLKEKRISELERERLKTDLRNKDKRLANITMNSIRRNNMLNELKSEVSELLQAEGASRAKSIGGRLLRRINAQLKDDSDWQLSENYFNTIYDGLLDRLRARYPALSQTDLRLCVYIKLNLSTKEIAGLMNISPRSVEMARYRLRKKLGLGPQDSIGSVLQ